MSGHDFKGRDWPATAMSNSIERWFKSKVVEATPYQPWLSVYFGHLARQCLRKCILYCAPHAGRRSGIVKAWQVHVACSRKGVSRCARGA